MKRFVLSILSFFLILTNSVAFAAPKITKQEIKVPATDGFNLKAELSYPKDKTKKDYSTVVLIHSLGYNSQWWENLDQELLDKGYAVLKVDLRGHGGSVYNAKLKRTSWKNLKNSAYAKYPDDLIRIIDFVKKENTKKSFFNNWALVASNIGINTGIIAIDQMNDKPCAIVMLSPTVKTKGLDIPISVAHLDNIDFLSITGTGEYEAQEAENYLKRFAQSGFISYVSSAKSSGMLLLKNDPELPKVIARWLAEYLH